jgi:hypothetical protein
VADQATASATTVVTQRNKDPIHARYERLLDGGTKPTLAKLSLARMIAAIAAIAANPFPYRHLTAERTG